MASAPDRVDPSFGDALAGAGGMTEPPAPRPTRDTGFDVFPDALSALPLPALTLTMPAPDADGVRGGPAAAPGPAGRVVAPRRTAAPPVAPAPPSGPSWSGFPPPGQPFAGQPFAGQPPPIAAAAAYVRPATPPRQTRPSSAANAAGGVLAPGSGRRPVAGVGYTAPVTTASAVVRPPAYLPQNPGLAGLRTAVRQARATVRPPAAPSSAVRQMDTWSARPALPSAARPGSPTGARRKGRASSAWSLFVFAIIVLVSTGLGQKIVEAVNDLWRHR